MEYIKMSTLQLLKTLSDASEIAVKNALVELGHSSPIVWRSVAMKAHGPKLIKRLEKNNLLHKKQHYPKGNYYYDVKELNCALTAENRHLFFVQEDDEKVIG